MTKTEAVQIVSEAANAVSSYRAIFTGEAERSWSAFLGELIVELLAYAKSENPDAPTTYEDWVALVENWARIKVLTW